MADRRIVRLAPGALYRDVGGDGVFVQLELGEYFGVDGVGRRVWQLLSEKHGDLDLVQRQILEEDDVSEATFSVDLDTFVAALVANKLAIVERE